LVRRLKLEKRERERRLNDLAKIEQEKNAKEIEERTRKEE